MRYKSLVLILSICFSFIAYSQGKSNIYSTKIKVLIIDGQNNLDQWPKITFMLKDYMDHTGLFKVDVKRTAYHADYSVQCAGFNTTMLRGTEWAATGNVTTPLPDDFPTAEISSSRNFKQKQ